MEKEFKYYNEDWEIIKILASTKKEANNIFKQEYPDKNIKDYNCILPNTNRKNYINQSFSDFERKEMTK